MSKYAYVWPHDIETEKKVDIPVDQVSEDTISKVLDERDYIPSEKGTGTETLDPLEIDISLEADDQDREVVAMPIVENNYQTEKPRPEDETEISLEAVEEPNTDDLAGFDPAKDLPGETDSAMGDDKDPTAGDDEAPLAEDAAVAEDTDDDAAADESQQEPVSLTGDDAQTPLAEDAAVAEDTDDDTVADENQQEPVSLPADDAQTPLAEDAAAAEETDDDAAADENQQKPVARPGDDAEAPSDEDPIDPAGFDFETVADEEKQASETPAGGDESEIKDRPDEQPDDSKTSDFVGLDDTETEKLKTEPLQSGSPKKGLENNKAGGNSEKITAEKIEDSDASEDRNPLKEIVDQPTKEPEAPKSVIRFTSVNKIISFALVALIITGFVLYKNPALIGLSKMQPPQTPAPGTTIETVAAAEQRIPTPPGNSRRDACLSKIEEAVLLRNVLLEKNEEIYELEIHYRKGIAELEEKINQELKRMDTTSYAKAVKNKHIELNLRTIQRRQAYINGLIKPAFWLNSGSEELFYLIRKAQLDMQLTEIADGIDLNKHTRHINAAIQKYRPSPDKLAVDPEQSKVPPLEKVWQQLNKKEKVSGYKQEKEQIAFNPTDKLIVNQICSGNFERIAELTNISSRAARCLAEMKGSNLFLNGLVTLSPDAAQQLFQWQGNWICLNGVKNLSPATAQYLFKWKGNWISLNGLNDFPPELAKDLLKWEGQQLELMGLKSNQKKTHQKTLKYLALWETTGGKLFVADKIRQEMKSLM